MAYILVNTREVLRRVYIERLKSSFKSMLDIEEETRGEIKSTLFIHNDVNYWTLYNGEGDDRVLSEYVGAMVEEKINNPEDAGVKQTVLDLEKIDVAIESAEKLSIKVQDRLQELNKLSDISFILSTIDFDKYMDYTPDSDDFIESDNLGGEDSDEEGDGLNSPIPPTTSLIYPSWTDLRGSIEKIYNRIYKTIYTDLKDTFDLINDGIVSLINERISSVKVISEDLLEDVSEIALNLLMKAEKDLNTLGVKITDFYFIENKFNSLRSELNRIKDINNNGI